MNTQTRRKPGRPANTVHGTLAARHPSGAAIGWSDGHWAGHAALVERARQMCAEQVLLPLGQGAWVIAEPGEPLAAYAVMVDLCGEGSVSGDVPADAITILTAIALADPDADEDDDV